MKNSTLNVIKAIASFLVVFIHCRFPGKLGNILADFARIAVPIFLLVSGFFSYNNDEKKLKKKIKHIFLLMLISNIVYFIWKIFLLGNLDSIKLFVKNLVLPKTIFKFLIFNDNPFRTHLWYFNAILYCYIIMYLYKKYINIKFKKYISKSLIGISFILLGIYIITTIFYFSNNSDKLYVLRNFVFVGFPFFYIGNFINKNRIMDKLSNKKIYALIIIFVILLMIELQFYTSEIYLFTIFLAIIIFLYGIKNPKLASNSILGKIGENYSSYIFIYHPLLKDIIIKVYKMLPNNSQVLDFIQPIIILFFSIIFSILLSKITIMQKGFFEKYSVKNKSL